MKGMAGGGGGSGAAPGDPSSSGIAAASKRTRSQNEGLDYCGLAEIEAGDVRDGKCDNLFSFKHQLNSLQTNSNPTPICICFP